MLSIVADIQPVQMLLLSSQEGLAEEQAHGQQPQSEPITGPPLQWLPVKHPFGLAT